MSESQFSGAGIIFLISLLCACGSKPSFEALTSAQTKSTDQSADNGKGKDPAGKKTGTEKDSEKECEDSLRESTVVALCHVDSDNKSHQICTDADTAKSKYGLDPTRPKQPGTNGTDHLGGC